MKFHRGHTVRAAAFTLAEIMVGIGLVAVFFTAALMALTKADAIASASRSSTGAYTIALKQIDWIQSATPFNPQKPMASPVPSPAPSPMPTGQTPVDYYRNMDGTVIQPLKERIRLDPNYQIPGSNPAGTYTEDNVAIYNDAPVTDLGGGVFGILFPLPTASPPPAPTFSGTMKTVITDVSPNRVAGKIPGQYPPPYIYSVTVTVTYTYRGRQYSVQMQTLRTSDT